MKILAINSSLRGKKGVTKVLIDKMFEGARKEGAECEVINLNEYEIKSCIACDSCQSKDHLLKCIHKDDFTYVFEKVKEADLVIFATPVYVGQMSNKLRCFFERTYSSCKINEMKFTKKGMMFHHVDSEFSSTPIIPLIVFANPCKMVGKNVKEFFEYYSSCVDAEIKNILVRSSSEVLLTMSKRNVPAVKEVLDAYVMAGSEIAAKGEISRFVVKKTSKSIVKINPIIKALVKLNIGRDKILHKIQEKRNRDMGSEL